MPEEKFDPNEPEEVVMERLEPVYGSDGQRKRAETEASVVEEGKRAAYAILKNGGARTGPELDKLIKDGWKPAERTPPEAEPTPPENAEESEGVDE